MTSMPTATVRDLRRAWDGTYLLLARCDACQKDVMHGAAQDADDVPSYLGNRVAHCSPCETYDLVDPDGIVAARLAAGVRRL